MSIERLETIRGNSYRSSCGKNEYCKETIDDELNRKYSERDENLLHFQLSEICQSEDDTEGYDAYLARQERAKIEDYHNKIDELWLARLTASLNQEIKYDRTN